MEIVTQKTMLKICTSLLKQIDFKPGNISRLTVTLTLLLLVLLLPYSKGAFTLFVRSAWAALGLVLYLGQLLLRRQK